MRRAWLLELSFAAGCVTAALLGRVLFGGTVALWLVPALLVVLARHLVQLYRLHRCMLRRGASQLPESWGVWGAIFDEYYRLQRRYRKRKKRLARVIREFRDSTAAMPDGTVVLNSGQRIVWFNAAAVRLLGLAGTRDLGQPIGNLLRRPAFERYLSGGDYERPVEIESPVDFRRTLSVRIVPYGKGQLLMLVRDVTRMKRLESMRRDFVANASHELRSPLTVIAGYLDGMREDAALPGVWQGPLAEMQQQCRRMNSLVEDLLELARLETDEPGAPDARPVPMASLIERICADAEAQAEGARHFQLELDAGLALSGVERELFSAVSNLVINAVRYTDPGGHIRIQWQADDQGQAVLEVSDDGIGIEARHLPFITQRFYRVDAARSRAKGGTGLGLAIVKHVLQRHAARLEVESTPGRGSTFRCLFPAERVRRMAA
ncbi:MAG: phosphate regulon sensor histidine kinase PhoR [Wenzhouxiangellaceae bacterium]